MTPVPEVAASLLGVVALLAGSTSNAPVPIASETVCTVSDPRIDEASGLVDLGRQMVVANDSGDGGVLYVLDRRCDVVGTTSYADPHTVEDVEALAPAGPHAVWVGDLGDNARDRDGVRDAITVRRVSIAAGERRVSAPSYRLAYPDGPHDAETLLAQPGTGRLFVVTKQVLRAEVFAVPARLDPHRANLLTRVASVPIFATDGSFLPDGEVLLRGYASVSLYRLPGWRSVASWRLPEQAQGESLSVGPGGRVRIGSEGLDQPVLQVELPDEDSDRTGSAATTPAPTSTAPTTSAPTASDPTAPSRPAALHTHAPTVLAGGAAVLAVLLGAWTARRLRGRRSAARGPGPPA